MLEHLGWIITLVIIVVAYFVGKNIESNHFEDLKKREKEFVNLPSLTTQHSYDDQKVQDCRLVTGNVVISGDYFKMILAAILKFFGGRIIGYEALIDRARREALLRMQAEAQEFGAAAIINTRFEMSKLDSMASQQQGTGMFEILVYGTAIKL